MEVLKGLTSTKALSEVYPVGSIYMSTEPTSPASLFGGEWSQLEEGQFLMNTKLASQVNKPTPAGLPNIEGQVAIDSGCGILKDTNYGTGVFQSYGTYHSYRVRTESGGAYNLYFSATQSNSIYGNSDTVQPYSLAVYMWKRTA